jgi:hypothetical protein
MWSKRDALHGVPFRFPGKAGRGHDVRARRRPPGPGKIPTGNDRLFPANFATEAHDIS